MNAVEVSAAVSELLESPFDAGEFPYDFLRAYGNSDTTIKRLRSGSTNKTGIPGALLQRNNIHMKVCEAGTTEATLNELRAHEKQNTQHKIKFLLATDGEWVECDDLITGDHLAFAFKDFENHFARFFALAGIESIKQLKDNPIDIKATRHLNNLYTELKRHNPSWKTSAKVSDMNRFMAQLIFCFFAESTGIFPGDSLFSDTISQMSDASDPSTTGAVISECFRAMNTRPEEQKKARLKSWANTFPYVNGELFEGEVELPKFSRTARSQLISLSGLDWKAINPDIFGSMIQAIEDEEERAQLGMHYTSVPNILKVLQPLFLNELEAQLKEAKGNKRKLLNLKKRIARIRVFDPACGSGNFLVIAYKRMRDLEHRITEARGEKPRKSEIPLTNFRGIEVRDFPAQIARLALIIAEYQCDMLYLGQKVALAEFLPLDKQNWVTCGNALRLNWLEICPPTGKAVRVLGEDLLAEPPEKIEIDFANEGGETYICGNPPYKGGDKQDEEQRAEMKAIFEPYGVTKYKSLDYVAGWFMKAAEYGKETQAVSAFVATNSICQGSQVPILWEPIFKTEHVITFAYPSLKWRNLAAHNAGVTVVIVGISNHPPKKCYVFTSSNDEENNTVKETDFINAYLVPGKNIIVKKSSTPISKIPEMLKGSIPVDGGHLLLDSKSEVKALELTPEQEEKFIRRIYGSNEFIKGLFRYCLWIKDEDLDEAMAISSIKAHIEAVKEFRLNGSAYARAMANRAHQFGEVREKHESVSHAIIVPSVSSVNRPYLPVGLLPKGEMLSNLAFALYDAPLWSLGLIGSRLHLVWINTICGKMEMNFRYSNTMGWNTFPVPKMTAQNIEDLTESAERILLARERHFPKTLAQLYGDMPQNLIEAHEHNEEIIDRIYIGRRFRNDTERLEHLFDRYAEITTTLPQQR